MITVSGQKDPLIRLLRELQTEDGRARAGLFFAEGAELVRRAFDYGGRVHALILTDRYASSPEASDFLDRAESAGAQMATASPGLLSKVLEAKPTPECLAIVERRVAQLSQILSGELPLVQVVERGENADNLGMLLRSADAARVDGAILVDTTDPFARRVVRGSRGAVFTVPLAIESGIEHVIPIARDAGLQVVAASARGDTGHTAVDYTRPTAIMVGNEHSGISDSAREMADVVVRIPMHGRINSLNIAVAASILLYEAIRQRS